MLLTKLYEKNIHAKKAERKKQQSKIFRKKKILQVMRRKFNSELIRLNKYISQSGLCSRRSADKLIISGKVKVNNKLCTALGTKISENDKVIVNNKLIKPERNIYILLNKRYDTLCYSFFNSILWFQQFIDKNPLKNKPVFKFN